VIAYSPLLSLEPYPELHLSDMLAVTARRYPDRVAFSNPEGASYTFAELWANSGRLARLLQEKGVKKGDTVGIYAPNCIEYPLIMHGIMRAGAIATTLNPLYREREVEHQLSDAAAVAVFCPAANLAVVEEARQHLPALMHVFEIESLPALLKGVSSEPAPVAINPKEDLAVLPYSSGTTGLPKGVMLSHFNLTSNIRQLLATGMITSYSKLLDFLPFYHIYGMIILMNGGIAAGASQIVLSRFDPEQAMSIIERERLTNLYLVPPAVLALANLPAPERFDTSCLQLVMSGAAPLPPEVGARASSVLRCQVIQGYGLTEASPLTNVNPVNRAKPLTVGPPVPDTLEKVVDLESGKELGPGEVGELLVYGPQVMKGYWRRPDATAETITPDGWLRTGDIVSMDEEGYVTILDRLKEMIKYRGYQVAPAELEGLLMEHPAVADAAVIPKPDTESGEVPKAFVVLRQGMDASAEQIMRFIEERVAPYKKLREVEFVGSIPKTASGKILRRDLIAQERERLAKA
jgi:acyl-CoA synthetase (AMP-forming)/AMP-acid ligase II